MDTAMVNRLIFRYFMTKRRGDAEVTPPRTDGIVRLSTKEQIAAGKSAARFEVRKYVAGFGPRQ